MTKLKKNVLRSFWRRMMNSKIEVGQVYESGEFFQPKGWSPAYILLITGIKKSYIPFKNTYYIKTIGGRGYYGEDDNIEFSYLKLKKLYKLKYTADEYLIKSIIE